MTTEMTKRCRDCNETKAADQFNKNKRSADGLTYYCKSCLYERHKKYRARPEVRDKWNARLRERYATDAGFRETVLERVRERDATDEHREKRARRSRERRREDPSYAEACRKRSKAWRERHKHKPEFQAMEAAKNARRRGRIRSTDDGTVTTEFLTRLASDETTCRYCDREVTNTNRSFDHIVPLARGGKHTWSNITVACRRCNSRKHASTYQEWVSREALS